MLQLELNTAGVLYLEFHNIVCCIYIHSCWDYLMFGALSRIVVYSTM